MPGAALDALEETLRLASSTTPGLVHLGFLQGWALATGEQVVHAGAHNADGTVDTYAWPKASMGAVPNMNDAMQLVLNAMTRTLQHYGIHVPTNWQQPLAMYADPNELVIDRFLEAGVLSNVRVKTCTLWLHVEGFLDQHILEEFRLGSDKPPPQDLRLLLAPTKQPYPNDRGPAFFIKGNWTCCQ
jgi:hypothetical protein